MGSLMSGWDSPVKDPKFAKLMRNKSLTNERIQEFWKLKKKTEQEHLGSLSSLPEVDNSDHQVIFTENSTKEFKRSSSLPLVDTKVGNLVSASKEGEVDVEDLMKRNCWWTRSNWAFLNEPPVIAAEVPRYKYASQHHVANLGTRTTKPDTRIAGI